MTCLNAKSLSKYFESNSMRHRFPICHMFPALHGIQSSHFSDILPSILSDICFGKFPLACYLPVELILTCYLAEILTPFPFSLSSHCPIRKAHLQSPQRWHEWCTRTPIEHIKIENSSESRLSWGSSFAKGWASKPTHSWAPLCQSLEEKLKIGMIRKKVSSWFLKEVPLTSLQELLLRQDDHSE